MSSTPPRPVAGPRTRLALVVLAETAALGFLRRFVPGARGPASWRDVAAWLDRTPALDAATVVLRAAAGATVAYLLLATLLAVVARASAAPPALSRLAGAVAPAGLRRLVESALAGVVASATLAAPAAAAPAPPGIVAPPPTVQTPAPAGWVPLPPPVGSDAGARDPAGTHVVLAGEHLWGIAAQQVARARSVDVAAVPAEVVAPQWLAVVRANADRLASGDPDVIHPGEVVWLPAIPPMATPDES